ncbi:MAG: hypothetical protein ACE5KH_00815 [Candidatus Geothermarchaeales archaeon]
MIGYDTFERSLGSVSRYSRTCLYGRVEREKEVLEALLKLGERRRGWVLYPTSDFFVSVVALHHETVSRSLVPTVAPWEATKYFIDKLETFRLAKRIGVPVPETHAPKDVEEAERLGDRLDFESKRWLVKVRMRVVPQGMLGPLGRAKGIKVRSRNELRVVCQEALKTGLSPPLVQEEIPGPPQIVGLSAVLKRGARPVTWMTVRSLRKSPYELGVATMAETTYDSKATRLGLRFSTASGAYGLCSMDFKEDPRDKMLKLIECNYRALLNSEIWRKSGVDLIHILHCLSTDSDYHRPRFRRIGVRWTSLIDDLTQLLLDREHYPLSPALIWRVAKEYLGTDAWGLLSLSDPVPFIAYALRQFGKRKVRTSHFSTQQNRIQKQKADNTANRLRKVVTGKPYYGKDFSER